MKVACPSKPKEPYRRVIEELAKRAGVELLFTKKIDSIKGYRVLLDPEGEKISMKKLGELVKKRDVVFIVGGPDGIDIDAEERLSLGDYVINHQIAIIVLLDLLFRAKYPRHPYNRH